MSYIKRKQPELKIPHPDDRQKVIETIDQLMQLQADGVTDIVVEAPEEGLVIVAPIKTVVDIYVKHSQGSDKPN